MKIFKLVRNILFTLLILTAISGFNETFSQRTNNQASLNADIQLANKYYIDKDFDKAAVLFKKIYDETKIKNYRDFYVRCLIFQEDYAAAEDYLKKETKKNANDIFLKIDLGYIYHKQNLIKDAQELFEQAVNYGKTNYNNVITVANAFLSYALYDYAEKTYLEGEKILKVSFDNELGNLYYSHRDYKKMMQCYCNLLLKGDENTLNSIQSRLQYLYAYNIDEDYDEMVESTILENIQKKPDNLLLSKLLIWQYTQSGKSKFALNQMIALDKRTNQNEVDILRFAATQKNNENYPLAQEALNYILNKGTSGFYYNSAFIENLDIQYQKLTHSANPSHSELADLEQKIETGINMVLKKDSYQLYYNLACLKAYYLNKQEDAISLIQKTIDERILTNEQTLMMKLLVADIFLLSGNPWDATLLYAQVEQAAIENPIGHEARFKKAKLAYYIGQFKWAQAQLDVLKASTSKLIANDALELSLFIAENYNLDTTETTMQMFARADFLFFSKQYEKALLTLDSVHNLYAGSSLADDILFRKGIIYEEMGNLQEAAKNYDKVVTDYFYDVLADNALFKYALIQDKLQNYEKADDAYFKLISEFPGSIFSNEARNKLRTKRNEQTNSNTIENVFFRPNF